MAPKSACILFAILSVLAVAVAAASPGTRIGGWQPMENRRLAVAVAAASPGTRIGGWKPMENRRLAVDYAKFAVAEYNKEKKPSLNFVSVIKGEKQVVEGTNYRLVIRATYAGAADPNSFVAVVYYDLNKHSLSLISFQQLVKN